MSCCSNLFRVFGMDGNDAVTVSYKDVSGIDDFPSHIDRNVDLSYTVFIRTIGIAVDSEYGKIHVGKFFEITDGTIDDEAPQLTGLGPGCHDFSTERPARKTIVGNYDYISGLGISNGVIEQQIVSFWACDGISRSRKTLSIQAVDSPA